MVRWPAADRMSPVSSGIVERFKKTAAAKDLEQDPREWVLQSWPWLPDAPYAIVVRAADLEERRFVMDADGVWTKRTILGTPRPTAA